MDIYQVIALPDPVLRATAHPVQTVDDTVRAQMKKMLDTMYAYEGVGLAANQVAILNRIIVIDTARRESDVKKPIAMANPEIIWRSEERWDYKEGCLSIPQMYADVERPKFIKVRYVDENNQVQEMDAGGLAATCIQHEVDHLDGVLFIDHLSRLRRETILKKYEKMRREEGHVL